MTSVPPMFHSIQLIKLFVKKGYGGGSVPNGQSFNQNILRNNSIGQYSIAIGPLKIGRVSNEVMSVL